MRAIFLADFIDVLERHSVLIGVLISLIVIFAVPSARRALFESFEAGQEARETRPALRWIADVVGVLLLVGVIVWLCFFRD